jgi:peptidoglycan/xylan/chitin deacetylase (PgdA/CDA1 family)
MLVKGLPGWERIQGKIQRVTSRAFYQRRVRIAPDRPIVSFTFDDYPESALRVGARILESHGALGTFYASLGLLGETAPTGQICSEEDVRETVARGHELGCHTFHHSHSWNTNPLDFLDSVNENAKALKDLIPGSAFASFSYPICVPRPATKRLIYERFETLRTGGQTFNAGYIDLAMLNAFFLEKAKSLDEVFEIIEINRRLGGWLVFATHDVADHHTEYGCSPGMFRAAVERVVASGSQICTVGAAFHKIQHPRRVDTTGRRHELR